MGQTNLARLIQDSNWWPYQPPSTYLAFCTNSTYTVLIFIKAFIVIMKGIVGFDDLNYNLASNSCYLITKHIKHSTFTATLCRRYIDVSVSPEPVSQPISVDCFAYPPAGGSFKLKDQIPAKPMILPLCLSCTSVSLCLALIIRWQHANTLN